MAKKPLVKLPDVKKNRGSETRLECTFEMEIVQTGKSRVAFGKKHKPKKIDIDLTAVNHDSPEVRKRLDRIEKNYQALGEVLADLESKIALDDRLAVDPADVGDGSHRPNKPR